MARRRRTPVAPRCRPARPAARAIGATAAPVALVSAAWVSWSWLRSPCSRGSRPEARRQRPARDDRHPARGPPRLLRRRRRRDAGRSTPWPRAACASRRRSPTRRSPRPPTPRSSPASRPSRHGVRDNGGFALPRRRHTLAEALPRRAGYRTAAFVSGFPLDRRFGLARGFDRYDDRLPRGDDARRAAYVERPADATTDAALRWLCALDRRRAPVVRLGALLRPARALRAAGAVPRPASPAAPTTARSPSSTRSSAGCCVARRRSAARRDARARHRGPRREPRRARRGHARRLRVRRDAAGAVDHGRPRRAARPRVSTVVAAASTSPRRSSSSRACAAPRASQGRSLRAARGRGATWTTRRPTPSRSSASCSSAGPPLHAWRTATLKLIDAPRPELYDARGRPRRDDEPSPPARSDAVARLRGAPAAALKARPPDATRPAERRGHASGCARSATWAARRPRASAPRPARPEGRHRARSSGSSAASPRRASDPALAVAGADGGRWPRTPDGPGPALPRDRAGRARRTSRRRSRTWRRSARAGRGPPDDLVLLAECLRLRGPRRQEALAALDRAAEARPARPGAAAPPRAGAARLGREDEAATAYEQVARPRPGQPRRCAGSRPRARRAATIACGERFYEGSAPPIPQTSGALVKLGVARDARRAASTRRSPLSARPSRSTRATPRPCSTSAARSRKSGRAREAMPYLESARSRPGPRTPVALNSLGFARLESGDARGALDALRASLALDPRQPQIAAAAAELSRGACRAGALSEPPAQAARQPPRRRAAPGRAVAPLRVAGGRAAGSSSRAAIAWFVVAAAPRAPAARARAEPAARHARHDARRPPRLLRLRRARGRGTSTGSPPRACASRRPEPRADHPARPRLDLHRPLSVRARRAQQRQLLPGRALPDARHGPEGTRATAPAAFVSSFILDRRYGLARGFDVYDDRMEGAQPQVVALEAERRGDRTALALDALAGEAGRAPDAPFFAWLHLYDPHEPYRPPPPVPRPVRGRVPTTARSRSTTPSWPRCSTGSPRLGSLDRTAGRRGRRPRREPRRARRGDALDVRLRERAPRAADPVAARRLPAGLVVASSRCARPTSRPTLLELLGAPAARTRRTARSLVPLFDGGAAPGRRRRSTPRPTCRSFYMNWAPLRSLRDDALQADRRAATRALRPRPRPRASARTSTPTSARGRARRCGRRSSA